MNRILCFLCLILTGLMSIQAVVHPKYHNPTGREFPILAWFSILPDSNLTRQRYMEMREAGFNISFSHFSTERQVARALRVSKGTGVKQMVACSELNSNPETFVPKYKNEEMLAGWFLRDEPTAPAFAELRKFRDKVYAVDSDHVVYLNLLPSLVTPDALGTKDYEDYVQRFEDEVNLSQISYDFYPIREDKSVTFVHPLFYDNLEVVRKVSRRCHVPFWAFVLSTAHNPYPVPSFAHLSLQAFCDLAYGAQCIQYFTYWTPLGTQWDFHNAPIDENLQRTDVYYLVKTLNEEIHNLTWVFLGADAVSVAHTGKEIPQGTTALTSLPAPFRNITSDGQGVLVSHLKNGKKNFLMIVNRDIHQKQQISMDVDKTVYQVLPNGSTQKVRPVNGKIQFEITPGYYRLFFLK